MSTCTVKLPDEIMNKLSEFDAQTGEIVEKSLKAGAEITLRQVKTNLQSIVGNGTKFKSRSTGELIGALGISPVKSSDDGYNIKIGFGEPRKSGESNSKIASIIEHGKKGQAAKPFMKPAEDATKSAAKAEIKRVFSEEANKILK